MGAHRDGAGVRRQRRGDGIAANAHFPEWYDDLAGRPGRAGNMVWWMFTHPRARERIANWADDARDLAARIRYHLGVTGIDSTTRGMIRALCVSSPDFHRWWQAYEVSEQDTRPRSFHHPRWGHRSLRLVVVHPAVSPTTTIVFHVPATPDPPGPGAVQDRVVSFPPPAALLARAR